MNFISLISQRLRRRIFVSVDTQDGIFQPIVNLQTLEERVLYSAAPIPVELLGVEAVPEHVEADFFDATFETLVDSIDEYGQLDMAAFEIEPENQLVFEVAAFDDVADQTSTSAFQELVVVDVSVEGYEQLLDDIVDSATDQNLTIRFVDSQQNGIAEVSRFLAESTEQGIRFSAIHLVSHGQAGQINLGSSILSLDSIDAHASDIASWNQNLTADADILIYGCNLAASENGQSLVERISELSQADVAASDDLTGDANLGGDWSLEFVTGSIEANIVFSARIIDSWNHVLETSIAGEEGTSKRAIAFDSFGNRTIVESNNDDGSWDVFVSRSAATANGGPLQLSNGDDFTLLQVNGSATGDHSNAVVASAANGDFAVAWVRTKTNGDREVFARTFDGLGNEIENEWKVANIGAEDGDISIAMNQNGRFVIGWEESDGGPSENEVYISVFDIDGTEIIDELSFEDNAESDDRKDISVSINDNGEIFVGYSSNLSDNVYARFITASGNLSNEFVFDDVRYFDSENVSADLNNDGKLAIAFETKFNHQGQQHQEIAALILEYDSSSNDIINLSPTHSFGSGATQVDYGNLYVMSGNDAAAEFNASIVVLDDVTDSFSDTLTEFYVGWEGQGTWQHSVADGTVTDGSGSTITSAAEFGDQNGDGATNDLDFIADQGVFLAGGTLSSSGTTNTFLERSAQTNQDQFGLASGGIALNTFNDRSQFGFLWQQADGSIDDRPGSGVQTATATNTTVPTVTPGSSSISGQVRNDVGADGSITGDAGLEGVRVLLYRDGSSSTPLETFTDNVGAYEFDVVDSGDYFIVVDSKTIGNGLLQNDDNALLDRVWAQQTFASSGAVNGAFNSTTSSAGALFGGRNATVSDDAQSLATSQHIIRRSISAGTNASDIDFGFSFNVVTNVEDYFDSLNPNDRSVQGSLRQFVNNANYLAGANHMKFVPIVDANQQTDFDTDSATLENWWRIELDGVLPTVFGNDTTLDGQAWEATSLGLIERDENAFNVRGAFAGDVGTLGDTLSALDAPELELVGTRNLEYGFAVTPDSLNANVVNVVIENFAISGFGDESSEAAIVIDGNSSESSESVNDVIIRGNVIGTGPNAIPTIAPDRSDDEFKGIFVSNSDNGLIENNFVGFSNLSGIHFARSNGVFVSGWNIIDNELRANGLIRNNQDGIDLNSSANMTFIRNAFWQNEGMGLDLNASSSSSGSHVIERNSFFENGLSGGAEGSGLRLEGDDSVVRYNVIQDNRNDGITVSAWGNSNDGFTASTGNLISQNQFGGNGQRAIDLAHDIFEGMTFNEVAGFPVFGQRRISFFEATDSIRNVFEQMDANSDLLISAAEASTYTQFLRRTGDGQSPNDGGLRTFHSNLGIDSPEIQSASLVTNSLTVRFDVLPEGADRIEIYTAVEDSGDVSESNVFGEGQDFVGEILVSSMVIDGSGRFVGTINTTGLPATIFSVAKLTAIGIDANNNTSEFGRNLEFNALPVASNSSVTTIEDQSYTFQLSDFGYTDANGDSVASIVISDLPATTIGQLRIDGIAVNEDQRILAAQITSGDLTFVPAADSSINASFSFSTSDGIEDGNVAIMNIVVLPVNDAPQGQNRVIETLEDTDYEFQVSDFGFSDVADEDSLIEVRIVAVAGAAELTLNGAPVNSGESFHISVLDGLRLTPSAQVNGAGVATVTFAVIDDGGTDFGGIDEATSTNVLTLNVTSVNDAPAGSDSTIGVLEDSVHVFAASDFGFSDVNDSDNFRAIRVRTLPAQGQLTLNGIDVTLNQWIPVTSFSELRFAPSLNDTGTNYATVGFVVIDDGGRSNEGENRDLSENFIQFDVQPRGDAPNGQDSNILINEDSSYVFKEADFGFEDPADGDDFAAVQIVNFSGTGSLIHHGVMVTNNQIIPLAELSSLVFTPEPNGFGSDYASLQFRVIDDGLDSQESTLVNNIVIDVAAVNDAPVLSVPNTIVAEGTVGNFMKAVASDIENDGLTFSLNRNAVDNRAFEIDSASGEIRFTSPPNFHAPTDLDGDNEYHLQVAATDSDGAVVTESATVVVTDVNEAPQFGRQSYVQAENSRNFIVLDVIDKEGDAVTYELVGTDNDNELFQLGSDGNFRFEFAPDFEAPFVGQSGQDNVYEIEVRATDTSGLFTDRRITIRVNDVPEAIRLEDDLFVDEGVAFGATSIFANDNNGNALPAGAVVSILSQPEFGIVTLNADGTFSYVTVGSGDNVQVEFQYVVLNGGESSVATVTLVPGVPIETDDSEPADADSETEPDDDADNESDATSAAGPAAVDTSNGDRDEDLLGGGRIENVGDGSGADTESNDIAAFEFEPEDQVNASGGSSSTYAYAGSVDTELLTNQIRYRLVATNRLGEQGVFDGSGLAAAFWQELESTKRDYFVSQLDVSDTALWKAGALSLPIFVVGLVTRAALLGVSLGATYSQPWWTTSFDLQPLIESNDNESIERMVDR